MTVDRFDVGPHVRDLAIAYGLTVPIGWDRERDERSAGLRTFPLVPVASCGFVQASEHIRRSGIEVMAQTVGGVIAGIGFIGAGTILREGFTLRGAATAASLWATCAIGIAVSLGSYDVAVVIAAITFLTLRVHKGARLSAVDGEDR
jgi:uncharacterized membrane protein YhiD involved in acid resistance